MISEDIKLKIYKIAEEQLSIRGLSQERIEEYQTLEELESSLQRLEDLKSIVQLQGVNDFLRKIKNCDINIGNYPDVKEVGEIATGIFIERKKRIIERICNIKNRNLKSLIEKLPEDAEREELHQQVKELLDKLKSLQKESFEQEKKEDELHLALREKELIIMERKSKIWLSFLAKESLASIIGAALLVIIMSAHIFTVFKPTVKTTDVLNNTFLIVLGYFFGQSASEPKDKKN